MKISPESAMCLLELIVREMPDAKWAKVYREKQQVKWRVGSASLRWGLLSVKLVKRGSPDFSLDVLFSNQLQTKVKARAEFLRQLYPEYGWPDEGWEFHDYVMLTPNGRVFLLQNGSDVRGVFVPQADYDNAKAILEMDIV